MNIEHELYGTQRKYGYIWWKSKDDEKFKQILPNNFILYIDKEEIGKCKVEWTRHRFFVGPSVIKRNFQKDDKIIISSLSQGKVRLTKK